MSPRLEARGLVVEVGGRPLFDGLDLQVEAGEALALLGPSGTGKTTLLRALAGLHPPAGGELRLDGLRFEELGATAWRTRVAWLDQAAPPLADTPAALAQELRGLHAQRHRAWLEPDQVAAGLGLSAETWRRPWAQLSGGERQRAHLAIALASQPEVLLLDEPTSALDPESRDRVEAALRGRTAVWVSHDEAQVARVGARALRLG